jgi:membrane protease YdiL (CAAX protease family)
LVNRAISYDEIHDLYSPNVIMEPPALGRWLLAAVTLVSFVALQLVLLIPIMMYAVVSRNAVTEFEAQLAIGRFLTSETGILLTVLAAASSGIATVALAFSWPRLWNLLSRGPRFDVSDWLAWRSTERLPLRLIPFITLPFLFGVALVISQMVGETQVDAQLMLFSTPALRIVSTIVVALVAPVAEEVVFRGALYHALLGSNERAEINWTNHAVPFVVTSIAFAALHVMAGFERWIANPDLVSLYLTAARTYRLAWASGRTYGVECSRRDFTDCCQSRRLQRLSLDQRASTLRGGKTDSPCR